MAIRFGIIFYYFELCKNYSYGFYELCGNSERIYFRSDKIFNLQLTYHFILFFNEYFDFYALILSEERSRIFLSFFIPYILQILLGIEIMGKRTYIYPLQSYLLSLYLYLFYCIWFIYLFIFNISEVCGETFSLFVSFSKKKKTKI